MLLSEVLAFELNAIQLTNIQSVVSNINPFDSCYPVSKVNEAKFALNYEQMEGFYGTVPNDGTIPYIE